jgi:hypothetical protein
MPKENDSEEFEEQAKETNSPRCFEEAASTKLLSSLKESANSRTKLSDKELIKKAKAEWHPIVPTVEADPAARPVLPPPKNEDLAVKPLCKQDERSSSEGPIRKTCITKCIVRSLSEPPADLQPGWETAPGIPKSGTFISILNRVRQMDRDKEARQSQAWRTYLELSAAAETRVSAASASGAGSSD